MNHETIGSSDIIQNIFEQIHLSKGIAAELRDCTSELEILQIAVHWARTAVESDRAVVYSLQADSQGTIVAESVDPQYPKTLNTVIVDPCFATRYIDQYQSGRVRAIGNIQQAGMTPCYLENLEKIGVKASLVVPLLGVAQQLYGLLVLHHCAAPHSWTQTEIDQIIDLGSQVSLTLDFRRQVQEGDRLRQELQQAIAWQQILSKIAKKLQASPTRLEVLQVAVRQTQMLLKCDRVVIYSLYASSAAKIIAEATQTALAPLLGRRILDSCFDTSTNPKYQLGQARAIDNIHLANLTPCHVEMLSSLGVKSNLVAPIFLDNGQLLGLLVAHACFEVRQWQAHEIEQIQQIATQAGWALTGARMQEKQSHLRTVNKSLIVAEANIQTALDSRNLSQAVEAELAIVFGEIQNLTRLLAQETIQSTQATTAEAQHLLQIIARRLQSKVERWEELQTQIAPQQQEIANLLQASLKALEDCKF